MNEHIHCDVPAVGLELGNQEDKEGGKDGHKWTTLGPCQQIWTVECVHTYKIEYIIRQISPLDLLAGVVQRGHFVIISPYRLFIPKGLWKNINLACCPISEQLTELSGHDCSNPSQHPEESIDKTVKCSVELTNITLVAGEKQHSDWDVKRSRQAHLVANDPPPGHIEKFRDEVNTRYIIYKRSAAH